MPDEGEEAGREEHAENVDDQHHHRRLGAERRRHDQTVHDQPEEPQAGADGAGDGDALHVLAKEVIGQPGRGERLTRARDRRLHSRLDDLLVLVRHDGRLKGKEPATCLALSSHQLTSTTQVL